MRGEIARTRTLLGLVIVCFIQYANGASGELCPEARPVVGAFANIAASKRPITVKDVSCLRDIESLSVSPDGQRFAIQIRQGDPLSNTYRAHWFVGQVFDNKLVPVGAGGELTPRTYQTGDVVGDIASSPSRWSPDGNWIAYTVQRNSETQVWRSRIDGSLQEKLTSNAGDVRDFAWSLDGMLLLFSVGTPRSELLTLEQAKEQNGYRFDEDLYTFTDFMRPFPWRPWDEKLSHWVVEIDGLMERPATEDEVLQFNQALKREAAGSDSEEGFVYDSAIPPALNQRGEQAWLERSAPASRRLNILATTQANGTTPIRCADARCEGSIRRVWWNSEGQQIFFWRNEGINDRAHAIYSWSPTSNKVARLYFGLDDDLRSCLNGADDRFICIRETPTRPAHLARISVDSGQLSVLVDPNPEFGSIELGKVERFEWETPKLSWNESGGRLAGLYPTRAYGYILFPPNFNPEKRYPVFIDPYIAHGFNRPGAEHALHVYAAQGMIVLNTAFPLPIDILARLGAAAMKETYSMELNYPHMTMLMESTVSALKVASARAYVDESRVGIGGVSHGTFVPLYMMQKHDLLAAISISSPTWGPHEYYWGTAKIREWIPIAHGAVGSEDWRLRPDRDGRDFWSRIDIADHVDSIEAPILMQLAADETYALVRLIRHLADAGKPYDAYVFRNETHYKWQPAHLFSIMNRNVDWMKFWLQGEADADPNKSKQYKLWRDMRVTRCADSRNANRPWYCSTRIDAD